MRIYVSDIFERKSSRIFEQNPQEIHLILGVDTVGSLFTRVIAALPWENPVALRTQIGWTDKNRFG